MAELLQFTFSGVTVGAIYALVALGFAIIHNVSRIINFAQGEFVMLGGMTTVVLAASGLPLPVAIVGAVAIAVGVGLLLERGAVEPARHAPVVTLIIITIGASIFLRGVAQVLLGKDFHRLPAFSGDVPIGLGGAMLQPQTLWVVGVAAITVALLHGFFTRTLYGKAMLATAHNPLAAALVGIDTRRMLAVSFGLAAGLGAVAGILIAPITLTAYDVGIMLGLKGFAAAILGGLGSFPGAIVGGLLLGLAEALTAGYVSSAYKDAIAFVAILAVLFVRPSGLLSLGRSERV